MTTALTVSEKAELEQHEQTIERGLKTFVETGNALLAIRDKRLYRSEYGTFDEYCRERWRMAQQSATRYIRAAKTIQNLESEPMGSLLPTSERQTRPLTKLEPEQQRAVWEHVVQEAQETGGRITGKKVQTAVDRMTQPSKPHVTQNTGNNEWYTPSEYADAARRVMGGIDCDPASSEIANRTIRATTYYTIETDGLSNPWHGRVWMNPPYSQPLIVQFCDALAKKYKSGEISEACVLVNNASETAWFDVLAECAICRCDIAKRIRFINKYGNPGGGPLQGQVVLYFGPNDTKFADIFEQFGRIWHAW